MICLSEPSFEAVRKRYVTYGLGADIYLSLCLAERSGVWKIWKLWLKATAGSKSGGALSRYSALTTRPEVPSPDTPFTQETRVRTFMPYSMPYASVPNRSKVDVIPNN